MSEGTPLTISSFERTYVNVINIHTSSTDEAAMSYAANADDRPQHGPWCAYPYRYGYSRFHPGLIVLMVLGFIFWWPLGLAMLAVNLWSRNMGCWGHGERWQHKMQRMEAKMERFRGKMEHFGGTWGGTWGGPPSSGNRAFDDYRADTLRRLEEEQREFHEFLGRLRAAKDKAEFDQFMADRRGRNGAPSAPPQG